MAGRVMRPGQTPALLMAILMAGTAVCAINPAFGGGPPPVTADAGMGTAEGVGVAPAVAPSARTDHPGVETASDAPPAASSASDASAAVALPDTPAQSSAHVAPLVPLPPPAAALILDTPAAATPERSESLASAPSMGASAVGPSAPGAPTSSAVAAPPPPADTPRAKTTDVADPLATWRASLAALLAEPGAGGLLTSAREQEALSAFYAARDEAPLFIDPAGLSERGKAVLARFALAEDEGLNPKDYALPKLPSGLDPQALARDEVRVAVTALRYARQAQAGRFDPEALISPQLTPARSFPDPLQVMNTLAGAQDAGVALDDFNPPHAGFRALRAKLSEARAQAQTLVVHVPVGPALRPGDQDARVAALRARLNVAPPPEGAQMFDPALAEAVRRFQADNGLKPDGVVRAAMVEILNRQDDARGHIADILVNMERWRWLPRDLGTSYVMVNIPEYLVRVVDTGRVVYETRVIVGKPHTPTPLLSRDMTYAVVNPYWNIPVSIARNEMLPSLQRDPYALARQGIEVTRDGRVVNPGAVNWSHGLGGYSFRQTPGRSNALGRIKFMFPNDHSVYLHDTSAPGLFASQTRAFSHGCMRVQDPLSFGEVVFNLAMTDGTKGGDTWTQDRIGKMLGGSERYLTFKHRIPVHVVYFTAWVDAAGLLHRRDDIYGIDAKMREILALDGPQRMAARREPNSRR